MTSEQAIRERSYGIWLRNGRPEGKSLEHCLQAEDELEREFLQSGLPPTSFSRNSSHDMVPRAHFSLPPRHYVASRFSPGKPDAPPRAPDDRDGTRNHATQK
jgi:hypothetical protein